MFVQTVLNNGTAGEIRQRQNFRNLAEMLVCGDCDPPSGTPPPRGQPLLTEQGAAGGGKLCQNKGSPTLAAHPSVLCKAKCFPYNNIVKGAVNIVEGTAY